MTASQFTTLEAWRPVFRLPTDSGVWKCEPGPWQFWLGFVEITREQYEAAQEIMRIGAWTEETIINLLSAWGYGPHD